MAERLLEYAVLLRGDRPLLLDPRNAIWRTTTGVRDKS